MTMVSAGMQVVGGVVGAMGAMQEAQAQAAALKYNIKVSKRNIKVIEDQGQAAMADQRSKNRRDMGTIRSQYGHAGVDLGGSALDVVMDTNIEQALEVKRIKYAADVAVVQERDKIALARMGIQAAEQAGSISAISSILGGIGGAASTMARAA